MNSWLSGLVEWMDEGWMGGWVSGMNGGWIGGMDV